ncbi:HlyD family secretion protein [Halomonadaceae bacterium KBTZ08]
MKVRFSSHKEQNPTHEGGLKVLYAPGKRAAFRLRWYLILLLVASPFLWFVGKLLMGVILVEAPGRITQPSMAIRALEPGRVAQIGVETDDQVEAGEVLVNLENPALSNQIAQLSSDPSSGVTTTQQRRQREALERQLNRADKRVRKLRSLVQEGAATQGELEAAQNERDSRQVDLAAFERSLAQSRAASELTERERRQLSALRHRQAQLTIQAPEAGRVRSIEVVKGENVGSGSLMMRIERHGTPRIHVFLDPERVDLASIGQRLQLQFPDGSWFSAKVTAMPDRIQRLPPDLRSPFGSNDMGIVVRVSTDKAIPQRWQVNNVPLTARFPNALERWWHQ